MNAFSNPAVIAMCAGVVALLALTPIVIEALQRSGRLSSDLRGELYARYFSWLVIIPCIAVPILAGRLFAISIFAALSLLAYREFARATGFFRERALSATVVAGILLLVFAEADHWRGFFLALPSLTVSAIVIIALLEDHPMGYIQRVALAVFAYVLFGVCIGHTAYLANDKNYRAIVLLILLCVELNDVFAYCCGKLFGRRKLAPNTSPAKTVAGAVGAVALTTLLFFAVGLAVFRGTALAQPWHLITMGVILSFTGQIGDLVISSVKRDLGIKDMGASIPGHGGLLDRFDSLIFVGPAMFHYINFFAGVGADQPARVWTGGW